MLDGLAGDLPRQEGANGIAFVQQLFEHADAILGRVMRVWRLYGSIHVHRPLVGILLNGTSLSTLMSPGSPSTRSAMMLRRISSVPPSTRVAGERSSMLWNRAEAAESSGSLMTPAWASRSRANMAIS